MNQIYFDNKPWSYLLFGLGSLSLLAAILLLLARNGNLSSLDLILIISFMITGVAQMTNYFGTQKTYLNHDSDNLTIKWYNRFTPYKINFKDIGNIYLQRGMIIIRFKTSRIIKLNISIFSTEQKKELYEFFITLSKTFDLKLSRRFN